MCGLAGFLGGDVATHAQDGRRVLQGMIGCIRHRGPDHSGVWHDPAAGIGLGHTRLAIVDLSPAGGQPMSSASGRYIVVYNGEIYNNAQLRRELEELGRAPQWRGHSDTETLLAAIEAWGIAAALRRAIGMFAFALWDRQERVLQLVRDRLGEKPLYYGWQGSGPERSFLFASEIRPLRRHPSFHAEIDTQAVTAYMRLNYIPTPKSIFRGISKLAPGSIATVRLDAGTVDIESYWSATQIVSDGISNPLALAPEGVVDELERLLMDAVGRQMVADVPLGAFLSGGIDSSTVVSLMQAQSQRPVKTFSIGFHEEGYDEAQHAKAVAAHLGTDHTELYVTASEAMAVIPSLPAIYDEPFADASQIPTFLVSRLARQSVTVSLSGDAGDELFAGYTRYQLTARMWRWLARIPRPMRSAAARLIASISPNSWDRLAEASGGAFSRIGLGAHTGHKVHKAAGVLASANSEQLYAGLTSHWQRPEQLVLSGKAETDPIAEAIWRLPGLSDVERMMVLDLVSYLPDDILAKVDRAGMAVSLEGRIPFLDHRVVEFAWRVPLAIKIRDGKAKWPLRQVLHRHVPQSLVERPKMGFGLPIDTWLRGPLRDWADTLLDERRLREQGILDPQPIRRAFDLHQSGGLNLQYQLWGVLMFQSWLDAEKNVAEPDNLVLEPAA